MIQAYEQQRPRERSKAYALFCKYRDLGPTRSLAKLKKSDSDTMVSLRQLFRYSAKFDWVERAEAYDRQVYAEVLEANEELIWKFNNQMAPHVRDIMDQAYLDTFSEQNKHE